MFDFPLDETNWNQLQLEGYLRVPGFVPPAALAALDAAAAGLLAEAPFGYLNPPLYSGQQPKLRIEAPNPQDRAPTIIIPNVGFLDQALLAPIASPSLYAVLSRILGQDFYLSNTWFQMVPPGTPRMAFHRDPRGSITLNILLDDIGQHAGSTCLIPRTHVNAPPVELCMDNILCEDRREVDMTGERGDLLVFSAETWHARSANRTAKWTRRLFYNFYARTSRQTTAWDGVVSESQLEAARSVLPGAYHHMLRVDRDEAAALSALPRQGLRDWYLDPRNFRDFFRDFAYAQAIYGQAVDHPLHPGLLLPRTTRLTEGQRFSAKGYFGQLKAIPTLKAIAHGLRRHIA